MSRAGSGLSTTAGAPRTHARISCSTRSRRLL
jgi:hypothetical protein